LDIIDDDKNDNGWADMLVDSNCIDDGIPVLVGLTIGWLDG
jgi:hypothetical protein